MSIEPSLERPPERAPGFPRVFGRFCDLVTEAGKVVIGAAMAAIVLITLFSVWWRYVLNSPIAWVEQVSNMLFIWITFIGAAILYRQQLHIAVDLALGMVPARFKTTAYWTIEVLNLVFIVMLFVFGLKLSIDVLPNTTGALDITPAWYYLSAPVSCLMMMLYFVEKIFDPTKREPSGIAADF